MRWVPVVLALAGSASADDKTDDKIEVHTTREAPSRWLDFDPILPPKLEGLGATTELSRTDLGFGSGIGRSGWVSLQGTWWENVDSAPKPLLDLEARGWRAGIRLYRDLGFATLSLGADLDQVDMRYGHGRYRELGVALTRTFHLSRWMTAWISLALTHRDWYDKPPAGEANDTTVMLTIGTTFK